MYAAKGAKDGKAMTAAAAQKYVAESVGLKTKDLNGAMEVLVGVTASVGKKGPFNMAGELNSKLMEKPVSYAN